MSVGPVTTKILPPLSYSMPKEFDKPAKGCPVKVGRDLKPVLVADVKQERRLRQPKRLGPQLDLQQLLHFEFVGKGPDSFWGTEAAATARGSQA